MSNNSCPPIPPELLKWLNEQYPEKSPHPGDAERDIWMGVGARYLVRGLNRRYEEQSENILEDSVTNVYEITEDA
jgi:hypothetical protein